MKITILAVLLLSAACYAQEQPEPEWRIMPNISVTKLFSVGHRNSSYEIQPLIYPPVRSFGSPSANSFSATGISFSARFLNKDFEPFAFTLSAGVNWYRSARGGTDFPMLAYGGAPIPLHDSLRYPTQSVYHPTMMRMGSDQFMSFPIGVGAQIVFPYDKIQKLMFFAGAEGNLSVLSRRTVGRHQVEAGFALLGGVAIKMVELGVRYSRFAGFNYVGVQAGIRFKGFDI